MRKGLWLKEEETEPGTRQPDGDRGLNILTVVLMERVLHWREANFTPGTNYFPEKKPRGHPRLMVQRSSYLTGILRWVWWLAGVAGLSLPCPDPSLEPHPKAFHLFPPLFL